MLRRCLAVVVLVVAAVVAIRGIDRGAAAPPSATAALVVEAPRTSAAGQPIEFSIRGAAPQLDRTDVLVSTAAGTHHRGVDLRNGQANLVLRPPITQTAGALAISVLAGGDTALAVVQITASTDVEPLVPLVGPKSIVADGVDHAMAVVVTSDPFGNPLPDRDAVEFATSDPRARRATTDTQTTGLIVWTRIDAGTVSGRGTVTASLRDTTGSVASLAEVADRPVDIVLRPAFPDETLYADGRRLYVLVSEPLVDGFGNRVPDGTSATLTATTPTGERRWRSTTIDGRLSFDVEASTLPGPVVVRAAVAGIVSDPIRLDLAPVVADLPVRIESGEAGTTRVIVGPTVRVDGGWIPDGTVVRVRSGDSTWSAPVRSGTAEVIVDGDVGAATVSVLGASAEVPL